MNSPLWNAAYAAISALKSLGYEDACFVGGVACALYGNSRQPHDLDILVLNTHHDQEHIKRRLTNADSSFFLVPSKKVGATYKVLWYKKQQTAYEYLSYGSYGMTPSTFDAIKVDILLPGVMDIPSFPASDIQRSNSRYLPAAPLALVLLLKLQAWSQHRAALQSYYYREQYKDSMDLDALVPIAAQKGIKPPTDTSLPQSFRTMAEKRVKEYLTAYPESPTRDGWRSMGYSVPDLTPPSTARKRTPVYTNSSPSGSSSNAKDGTSKPKVKPLPRYRPVYSYRRSRY